MATPTPDQASLLEILTLLSASATSAADRRRAEDTYKAARRSNADMLLASLVQLGQPGAVAGVDDATREYCFVLLRRLLQPEVTDEGKIAFNACSDATKQGSVDLLLKQFGGLEQGQTPESVRIHQKVGNCLVSLADNVILPEVNDEGKREEQKWPDLLKTTCIMANGGAAGGQVETEGHLKLRCNALKVLCELLTIYPETIKAMSGDMQTLLESGLGHTDMGVKTEAVELVLSMVKSFKAKEWKVLQKTLPVILGIVEQLAQQKKEDMLQAVLESLTECCEYEGLAIFFKPEVRNIATLISKIISAKQDLESETRAAGLEFLITLAEQKPKMCTAQYSDFPSVLLGCTMNCLLETEFDEESWSAVMEDEEDDEEDELYKLGSEVIDRAIMAFGMKKISESYKEAIRWHNVKSDSAVSGDTPEPWRHAVAALSAVSEGVEYVEDDTVLDSLMELCLSKTTHAHTRVRSQAWHALSRIFNDHGDASERWHDKYMAATKQTLAQDPVARVQQKCLGAFLYFGEALESVTMEDYSRDLLQTLVAKLGQNDLHRGVREECITSIAVVAGSIGKEFGQYYNDIMPFLKNILLTSTVEKETRLRGKAFECMSLLGVAVGRAKFRQDGSDCLRAMLGEKQTASVVGSPQGATASNLDKKNSEVLSDYLKDAVERIAGVMEEDLGPFLSQLLETFLRPLDLNNLPKSTEDDEDDEDAVILADGQKVKSAVFREMKDSCDVLTTLLQNCKNSFYEGGHIPRVCGVLHQVLKCNDESIRMSLESDEVMEGASDAWAACIGILAKKDQKTCQDYLIEYCKSQVEVLNKDDDDVEVVGVTAKGIADVLSAACPTSTATPEERALFGDTTRYLDQNTLTTLWGIVKTKMETCLKKREESLIKGHEWADGEEDAEGEVGNLENSDEHHDCAIALSQIVGSLMQLNPAFFVQTFMTDVKGLVGFLLDSKNISAKVPAKDKSVVESKNKILAYFIACDLAEYLKQDAAVLVLDGGFMGKLFGDLQNVSCEVRHAACYCVYLMAGLDGFRDVPSVAGVAFEKLIAVMRGGKKMFGKSAQSRYISTEEINLADDNLSASAFQILALSPQISAAVGVPEWDLVLSRLPLKADVDMNSQVIAKLIEITQVQQRADVLGPNQSRVAKICGVLAESYRSLDREEEAAMTAEARANPLSSENLDKKIQALFGSLGESVIGGMKGSLSGKQWKKVEKIVREARVN